MVQVADTHIRVAEANISQGRGDDGCIPGGDKCSDHQQDDFSEPLIKFIRTVRRKLSVLGKNKDAMIKKNDLVSADILDGRKSASCLADEGIINPTTTKTKEFLVYRRRRFRVAKSQGGYCKPVTNKNLAPAAIQVEDVPASAHGVNVTEPSILLQGKLMGELQSQAANQAWGTHMKRSRHRRNKFTTKKQSLGGIFPFSDDAMRRFKGK